MRKVFVTVFAEFTPEGRILPQSFTWDDGRRYAIDRVLDVRQAASLKAGGQGQRFTYAIITSLSPSIDSVINDFYNKRYKILPGFQVTEANIEKIERPNGDRTQCFIIDVVVTPFFGPHIFLGKDEIEIQLSSGGEQKVLKHTHLKSYDFPKNRLPTA